MEHTVVTLFKDGDRVSGAFAYDRERGRFKVFRAKAIVLATGGIGRAYSITSNSWEYTGDGHSLAYHAGAVLQDMEFVQFHPDGHGLAAKREGHPRHRRRARRRRHPDEQEWPSLHVRRHSRTTTSRRRRTTRKRAGATRRATRTRAARPSCSRAITWHAASCARCKEGRGSPHGGVFLDISWIKERLPNAAEHIKKKLPSMYHQFKQLADIDITTTPMEVGPTTHYVMGGIRVDGDSQNVHGAGPVRGRRVRRRTAWRQSPWRQLAVGPARVRKASRRIRREVREGQRRSHAGQRCGRDAAAKFALAPFERAASGNGAGDGPYQIQYRLQGIMQDGVGIVRREPEMLKALAQVQAMERDAAARHRARATANTIRAGTRRSTFATCSRSPKPSLERRSSERRVAAGTSATTTRTRIRSTARSTSRSKRRRTVRCSWSASPFPPCPPSSRP